MAEKSLIEWTDATWNPITGCTLVDEGCRHCYAAHLITSWPAIGNHPSRKGLARKNAAGESKFTGEVRLNEQWIDQPLRWRKPRRIFVCAHGDLFHPSVPDEWIDRVFAVMALAPQHAFQVLTKRPERAREYLKGPAVRRIVGIYAGRIFARGMGAVKIVDAFDIACDKVGLVQEYPDAHIVPRLLDRPLKAGWPLPNVWLGTSISDQASADLRINHLLDCPAAIRFISAEPLLGPLNLNRIEWSRDTFADCGGHPDPAWPRTTHDVIYGNSLTGDFSCEAHAPDGTILGTNRDVGFTYDRWQIDWVICGGESGPHARPMHPDWARALRDQCVAAGVPFLFKQWGEWGPSTPEEADLNPHSGWRCLKGHPHVPRAEELYPENGAAFIERKGKKAAGRKLDGVEWSQFPEVPR